MPRASSSASSGTAYLRLTPACSRNVATVKPAGIGAQQLGGQRGGGVDRRRCGTARRRARRGSRGASAPGSSPGRRRAASPASTRPPGSRPPTGGRRTDRRTRPAAPDRLARSPRRASARRARSCSASAAVSTHARRRPRSRRARAGASPRASSGVVAQWPTDGSTATPVSSSSSSTSTQPRSAIARSTVPSGAARDAFVTGAMSSTSPPPTVSSRPDSRST